MYKIIIFSRLLLNPMANQSQSTSGTSAVISNEKLFSYQYRMTKMAAMAIFGENPYILFAGTRGSLTFWFGI